MTRIIRTTPPRIFTRRTIIRTIPLLAVAPGLIGSPGCEDSEFLELLLRIAKTAFSIYEEISGNGEIEYGGNGGQTFRLIADLFEGTTGGDSQMVSSVQQEIVLEDGKNPITFGGLQPVNIGTHFVRGRVGRTEANTADFEVEM